NKEWFADWFDSPYYHILYKNRDYTEAELFLNNIVSLMKMPVGSSIIDLACGKGRHSVFLNNAGFKVKGVDLSANSIDYAKQFENENLHFEVADLRNLCIEPQFDYAFNLFTSFAYFKSDEENQQVLNQFRHCLKPNGILLLDFFNAEKVKLQQNITESKTIEGITFHLKKVIENQKVIKQINFEADSKNYYFHEEVQLLTLYDFEKLFEQTGFKILNVFGNYHLENYEPNTSDRLIFLAQKI
ncbi:MAG: class I SAM-dependent methyltransferase, partial [Bacteroidia bacterium]